MITVSDIEAILYKAAETFGLTRYPWGNVPDADKQLLEERVVIRAKSQKNETYWKHSYAEVNLMVPDTDSQADLVRLAELERMAHEAFDEDTVGEWDGTAYRYAADTVGIEEDTALKCHYVNVRILFSVLNY